MLKLKFNKKNKSFKYKWSGEGRLIYPSGTLKIYAKPISPTSDLIKVETGLMNEVGEVVQAKTNFAGGKANENLLIDIQFYPYRKGATTYRIDLDNIPATK